MGLFSKKNTRQFGQEKAYQGMRKKRFGEDASTRDVHGQQQLERGDLDQMASKTGTYVGITLLTILVAVMTFIVIHLGYGMYHYIKAFATQGLEAQGSFQFFKAYENGWFSLTAIMVNGAIFMVSLLFYAAIHQKMMNKYKIDNIMADTKDLNQHQNDQHIMLLSEMQETLNYFPDSGAHSSVQVSSLIGHMMLSKKGLKKIDMVERYDENGVDDEGDKYFKSQPKVDKNGEVIINSVPIIDEVFGQDLFTASAIPEEAKDVRTPFEAKGIPYNPHVNGDKKKPRVDRDKLKYTNLDDLINNDWEMPLYEVQRPAGAYFVDTAPINTMILAITRAGKGQTLIEPTIDMWTREKRQNNIVINDPKGELLTKFFVPATVRGYEVIQFNLINVMSTDVYNPLGFAAQFAREGDFTKAASYVDNIGQVFFPAEGADDPMWRARCCSQKVA